MGHRQVSCGGETTIERNRLKKLEIKARKMRFELTRCCYFDCHEEITVK